MNYNNNCGVTQEPSRSLYQTHNTVLRAGISVWYVAGILVRGEPERI